MRVKSIVIGCVACLLAACLTPAPETAVPAPSATPSPVASPTPPPTTTPTLTPVPTATPVPRLAIVLSRGNVICGLDSTRSELADFEADYCRAIASALFDDPEAVDLRPLDREKAWAALRAGEIDLYFNSPDHGQPDLPTGQALFFEAAGAMSRGDVGITQIAHMKYVTVCLIQDSGEERVFHEAAAAARVTYQPLLFNAGDLDAMYLAYDQGRCDVIVDDRVRLWQRRSRLSVPRDHQLLELALLTGQRAPITHADSSWAQINQVISSALIGSEELGLASDSLDAALSSDDSDVRRLLGLEGDSPADSGLTRDFVARIIRRVGNYGEIYNRHFPDLPRGPNALARDGGWVARAP